MVTGTVPHFVLAFVGAIINLLINGTVDYILIMLITIELVQMESHGGHTWRIYPQMPYRDRLGVVLRAMRNYRWRDTIHDLFVDGAGLLFGYGLLSIAEKLHG